MAARLTLVAAVLAATFMLTAARARNCADVVKINTMGPEYYNATVSFPAPKSHRGYWQASSVTYPSFKEVQVCKFCNTIILATVVSPRLFPSRLIFTMVFFSGNCGK